MKTAFRFYSWNGLMKDQIDAIRVKSHSDARKLGPFVSVDKLPLIWVNWSKPNSINRKQTKPYFRHYPKGTQVKKWNYISIEEEQKDKKVNSESEIHKLCRTSLHSYLANLINKREPINWSFLDKSVSNFLISGNFLSEVESVETNYKYKTPFNIEYEFDIALLGRKLSKERIILGAIEIEKTHKFGFLKLLVSKTLGFPLISVNVEDLKISDIDEFWCKKAVSETTNNSDDGLRRNYIYIHNFLYPVYTDIPYGIRKDEKHQFIIFCINEQYDKLYENIRTLRKILDFPDNEILIQPFIINRNEPSSISTSENEGSIAGPEWRNFNDKKYLRITLPVPTKKKGNIYLFHLALARLLNAHYTSLVGYKYCKGVYNHEPKNPIWRPNSSETLIIPKNMSEPINNIIDYFKEFGIIDN
jgi:hypothetical protein